MKKDGLIQAFAIFFSILGSFGVERYINYRNEQNELKIIERNLLNEMEQNYYSLLSLRGTIESVVAVNDSILVNWEGITSKEIRNYHSNDLYDVNEKLEYILSNSYGYEPKTMYINSLIYSGLILKINSKLLRNKIESFNLYVNSEWLGANENIELEIRDWFKQKSLIEKTLNNDLVFDKYKNFELFRMLRYRRTNEIYKLGTIRGNIRFLEDVIKEIKENGLF